MQHGGLNVLITNPRDIPAFVNELRRWRFTIITGVNTLYNALLDHPEFARLDFSGLKLGAAGGMALHPTVAEKWANRDGQAAGGRLRSYGSVARRGLQPVRQPAHRLGGCSVALHGNQRPRGGCRATRRAPRRALRARSAGHARVLEPAGRDREDDDTGRMVAHRRYRDGRRGRIRAHRRSQEGHDHRLGIQGVSERDRERRRRAPRRARMRLYRSSRSAFGSGGEDLRRQARRRVGQQRGDYSSTAASVSRATRCRSTWSSVRPSRRPTLARSCAASWSSRRPRALPDQRRALTSEGRASGWQRRSVPPTLSRCPPASRPPPPIPETS